MLNRIAPLVLLLSAITRLPAQVSTSHVMSAPWGQLVTNSSTSFDVASVAMRRTALRFRYLLGDTAPLIGLVVDDSSAGAAEAQAVSPEAQPVVLISGSVRPNGSGRAELDTMVRIMTASTWVDEYAQRWRASLLEVPRANGPETIEAPALPDWIRLGAVSLLSEGESANLFMRDHMRSAIPLRGLFALRVGATDDLSVAGPEAASVLSYLRAMEGVTATRDFFGMLATGSDVTTALSALPRFATIESLEVAWRRWLSAAPTDAVLPTTGVR